MRVGFGYDIHRLVPGRPLILGGVSIAFERGLDGHSDADVVCHAVADALLGAAALGDIGMHFPDTDPAYKNASSIALLESIVGRMREHGYRIANVDATILAEAPRLLPHREAICSKLAGVLGVAPARVSVKATTNEGLDAVGRGEAIAVHAVAVLEEAG